MIIREAKWAYWALVVLHPLPTVEPQDSDTTYESQVHLACSSSLVAYHTPPLLMSIACQGPWHIMSTWALQSSFVIGVSACPLPPSPTQQKL